MKIHKILIKNFKSIRKLDFELNDINVLIGVNGVGKSNFISFFKFMSQVVEGNLREYVAKKGGADNFLYYGRKQSPTLNLGLIFENSGYINKYKITLAPTEGEDIFFFQDEVAEFSNNNMESWYKGSLRKALYESRIAEAKYRIPAYVATFLKAFKVCHFHDTSDISTQSVTLRNGVKITSQFDAILLPSSVPSFSLNSAAIRLKR